MIVLIAIIIVMIIHTNGILKDKKELKDEVMNLKIKMAEMEMEIKYNKQKDIKEEEERIYNIKVVDQEEILNKKIG